MFLPEHEVTADYFDWADAYVACKPICITPHIPAITGLDEAVNNFPAALSDIENGKEWIVNSVDVSRVY